jgi:hypothetical protein
MHPQGPSSNSEPAPGLPPVTPPSPRFIAQLFLIPFVIVVSIVVLFLGISELVHWMVGGPSNPQQLLRNLDDANPEVRWRAANDLAQVLLRDDRLASEPRFTLDLAERLQAAVRKSREAEQSLAGRLSRLSAEDAARERRTLEPAQHFVQYLAACLGSVTIPTGVPLLKDMALEQSGDPETVALRRRQAVWALANLGENLKRFDQLAPERKQQVLEQLEEESLGAGGDRPAWAAAALKMLRAREAGQPDVADVAEVLSRSAADDNPELRELVAFAATFWEGTPEQNKMIEKALARLSYDNGHGASEDAEEKGRVIRYNATRALARRGSAEVRLGVLGEMLDRDVLGRSFWVTKPDKVVTDPTQGGEGEPQVQTKKERNESMVNATLESTLRAVAELHRRNPGLDLKCLRPAVERLTEDSNSAVRKEAKNTLEVLGDPK